MTEDKLVAPGTSLPASAQAHLDQARHPATEQRYAQCWASWASWAASHGHPPAMPVPPPLVALWLSEEANAGVRYATLRLRVTALLVLHARHGHELDTRRLHVISEMLCGIRRTHGTAQRQAQPIMVEHLRVACGPSGLPATLHGLRDRALLLVGWAAALRASELVALQVAELAFDDDGVMLTLPKRKTDQDRQGTQIGLPYGSAPNTCPVRTLRRWLTEAQITAGPVFREMRGDQVLAVACTWRAVDRLVRRVAVMCGFDPEKYSSHSLRAGLITSARLGGKDDATIKRTTGHKHSEMIDRYSRGAAHLYPRVAEGLGL
jgi:integrase